eukprot:CAMPEP_0175041304 /NCGR_PEP_ID=MMETSP0052_2-20121109/1831_1 /TAXON_ID=51329 ORGANISM="Polytomella parva, Strain SAG 63-3" /NCGR_SAMPLE_ID=MMETSP0052_2 /ASSEMBLY_ACC=CAM_ASM_000194 /LENGTH=1341 /DNA_ID=CAMNT_0016303785 /DNA_START=27 /DNA_END=4052 /DNA_ORIENTATION=+
MQAGLVQGDQVPEEFRKLVEPHVSSFDYFLNEGMERVVDSIEPVEIEQPGTGETYKVYYEDAHIDKPVRDETGFAGDFKIYPRDCREAGTTYKGAFTVRIAVEGPNDTKFHIDRRLGSMPIMVGSSACHLAGMNRQQLVAAKEESTEMGGYFICNGIERIIRCLVVQRRHYIMALRRGAYHKRGANYTDAATLIRCVRPDESSATVRCHYLTDGTVNFAFTMRRAEYFIPAGVLLKCFLEVSDRELYEKIVSAGAQDNTGLHAFLAERAELLLRQADRPGLRTRAQCVEYLGRHFRVVLKLSPRLTDFEVGEALLKEYVFVHLSRPADKLALLLSMLHKLYALVNGACSDDNPDALTHHEILLPGLLLIKFLKEKMEDVLGGLKEQVQRDVERQNSVVLATPVNLANIEYVRRALEKAPVDVGAKFEYLMNTGNLVSKSGLDLSQATGYTVVAEKLNFFRYLSHFRSVHRGAYFAELRTTTVRKLLPESWGFMCPVHTPDGSPCGLLNHFAALCDIVTQAPANATRIEAALTEVLQTYGVIPSAPALVAPPPPEYLEIQLDGKVIGHIRESQAKTLVARLRVIKACVLHRQLVAKYESDTGCRYYMGEDAAKAKVDGRDGDEDEEMGEEKTMGEKEKEKDKKKKKKMKHSQQQQPSESNNDNDDNNNNTNTNNNNNNNKNKKKATMNPKINGPQLAGVAAVTPAEINSLSPVEWMVPAHLEIVHISPLIGGPFPGIFIFSSGARMTRPVLQIGSGALEMIGSLEQCNMAIQCPDGGAGGTPGLDFTHKETRAGAMLSVVASMTPYSDYNQSPRNMYQCQMGKQTMGTPGQALHHRTDTKMYRIQTPQTPIARTCDYDKFYLDEFPNGTNAVVAVLAYTGYDMEDAMILNKSAMERGLGHATLYKTEMVDLREEKGRKEVFAAEPHTKQSAAAPHIKPVGAFGQRYPQNLPVNSNSPAVRDPALHLTPAGKHKDSDRIEADGLPAPGTVIWPGQAYYGSKDLMSGRHKVHKLKGEEVAVVDSVTLIGTDKSAGGGGMGGGGSSSSSSMNGPAVTQRANIKYRLNRNPMIGDKFSSRHGQKGVLSILWPDVDMPYCAATGIRPDLIINPHAFPSRMTIGMLVESLVSKAGALKGEFVDASPFQRSDGKPADPVNYFGNYLEQQGFAKLGQEKMVSGVTGEEMPCDIYIGLVYYQRLRHMVSDKFQVRSIGPINNLTRQPIKGRKFGGGIRFGEMERDSLLAHGAAYLLHDRLHACSDYHVMDCCTKCGSLLAPLQRPAASSEAAAGLLLSAGGGGVAGSGAKVVCPACQDSSKDIERVAMPYVFKYLATELAAMNIKIEVEVK